MTIEWYEASNSNNRVWDWNSFADWKDEFRQAISNIVTDAVEREFLLSPPEYVVGDDLSWLDDLFHAVHGKFIDSREVVTDLILDRYQYLRAYHGTNIDDPERVYKFGLRRLLPSSMHTRAEELFLSGAFPELDVQKIQLAIDRVGSDLREGCVFFEANERVLVEHCGHYMIYGSEYLLAIAAHIQGSRDYRKALRYQGKPTVFVCDVPIELMRRPTVSEFAGTAIELLFESMLDGDASSQDQFRPAGFPIHFDLPPSSVIGHFHPTNLRDPLHIGGG